MQAVYNELKTTQYPWGLSRALFPTTFLERAVYESYIWFPIAVTFFFSLFIHFLIYLFFLFADNSEGVYMIPGRLSRRRESTPVPFHSSTFVYMIPPQNVKPARVNPAWVHPGCCTGARISLRYEISKRYHVNVKRPHVSVWNLSAGLNLPVDWNG